MVCFFPGSGNARRSTRVPPLSHKRPRLASASLRKSVRIVSSKQVIAPGDEEEGEILYNLRIEIGRNSQSRVNREMRPPQGRD